MQGLCPKCNGRFDIQPEWVGQQAQCPYCHEQITVQPADNAPLAATPILTNAGTGGSASQNNATPDKAFDCFTKCVKNYACFSGRASRKEYWFFVLFHVLISVCLGIIGNILGVGFLQDIFILAMLLPALGVSVRRLHDIGKSGWWYLIVFIPIVGSIVLLVFASTRGIIGPNEYGSDPYEGKNC